MLSLDPIFSALSDPTRRALLARLAQGEATVDELAAPFDISQPAISRHLKILEDANLISTRIAGTSRPRRLNPKAFTEIESWLDGYRAVWADNFARLDDVLAQIKDNDT